VDEQTRHAALNGAALSPIVNPFIGNFDLPERKCFNELLWFYFNKTRHIFIKIFNFGDVTKKVFFALSDASRCVFENSCSTNFAT
jgi:hypothetical protein